MNLKFNEWPKIHRLYRDVTITEKIDGTNACICILPLSEILDRGYEQTETYRRPEDGAIIGGKMDSDGGPGIVIDGHVVFAQSRKKVISPGKQTDNYGFAGFVRDSYEALYEHLGEGRHFGEWYGQGIQRGYGAQQKMFALFNAERWRTAYLPTYVTTVPVLYEGVYSDTAVRTACTDLRTGYSRATGATGGAKAEGVVVYFQQANTSFKVLLEDDDVSKFEAGQRG